jgi:hypothetical protein
MQSDVRFTQAQKWDLLRMSGAAVVSTVFFGIPMFVARPAVVPEVPRSQAQPAAEVSVLVSDTVASVTPPEWEAVRVKHTPSRRRVASATPQSRQQRQLPSASGRPLAHRIGRLLAGTGRYEVRPFPSLEYLR